MKKLFFLFITTLFATSYIFGQSTTSFPTFIQSNSSRTIINLDTGWNFRFHYDAGRNHQQMVNLPYTWEAEDVLNGKADLTRTMGIYTKTFFAPDSLAGKRVFLYFYGANSVAYIFLNKKLAGKHTGGYTAFCFEITNYLKLNANNTIEVQVTNAYNPDLAPLNGDFNVYGGLHRPVSMIITQPNCITPLDYASSGVFLTQKNVSRQSGDVEITTHLSLEQPQKDLEVRAVITDNFNKVVKEITTKVKDRDSIVPQRINIRNPHLWSGTTDPYLYTAKVTLLQDHQVIDEITQPLGLRYFRVSADSGFF